MKRLFISQPMKGRTDKEILTERENIIEAVKSTIDDEVEVLDTFFTDHGTKTPLECLAKSIEMLSDADIAVFLKGWEYARGCSIEHKCCVEYGIDIIYTG